MYSSPTIPIIHPDEIIIDNFAGAGGASIGIEQGAGRHVDVAINHSRRAIATHQHNHPNTLHLREDVWNVDPVEVVRMFDNRRVGLAWFSPDCTHHSKARGGKPRKKNIRALCWVVIRWIHRLKPLGKHPRIIMLENVEEFRKYGPLDEHNRPIKSREGEYFNIFTNRIRHYGYTLEIREIIAADHGDGTTRKRLFMIARCDGKAITWPEPTHAPRKFAGIRKLQPYVPAAQSIDWSLPCPSIFDRPKPLAHNTCKRIATGTMRYVVGNPDPFIVRIGHTGGGGNKSYPISDPLTTITSKAEHCLVTPTLVNRLNTKTTGRGPNTWSPEEPLRTITTMNGFGLVSGFLAGAGGPTYAGKPAPIDQPFGTILQENHRHLCTAFLTKYNTGSVGSSVDEPMPTITAGGKPARPSTGCTHGLITAHILKNKGTSHGAPITDPLHTIATGGHHGLITGAIVGVGGRAGQSPPRPLDDPMATHTAKADKALVTASLIQTGYGEREGQAPRALDIEQPLGTIVGTQKHALIQGDLFSSPSSRSVTPDRCEAAPDLPEEILAACHRVYAFLLTYYGQGGPISLQDPLDTITTRDRFGLVYVHVDGQPYPLYDLGLRMLQPHELAKAQGFPDTYILTGNKSEQVAQVGNSVCPGCARALVSANYATQRAAMSA